MVIISDTHEVEISVGCIENEGDCGGVVTH